MMLFWKKKKKEDLELKIKELEQKMKPKMNKEKLLELNFKEGKNLDFMIYEIKKDNKIIYQVFYRKVRGSLTAYERIKWRY